MRISPPAQAAELAGLRSAAGHAPVLETVLRAVRRRSESRRSDLSSSIVVLRTWAAIRSRRSRVPLLLEDIYDIEVPAGVINNPAGSLEQVAELHRASPRDRLSQDRPSPPCTAAAPAEIRASDLTLEKF